MSDGFEKQTIRVGYMSDTHLEPDAFSSGDLKLPECDVLVLAGDICEGTAAIEGVRRIAKILPKTEVVYVMGNHESYGFSIDNLLVQFRQAFNQDPKIHFLENDRITIRGITFLGSTLWTGFNCLGKDYIRSAMREAERCIADFNLIQDEAGSQRFTPFHAVKRYRESCAWLATELKTCIPETTIVVTHFPPCREARHQQIPEDLLSAYFQANCVSFIEKYQPAYWIYGHNHYSMKVQIGNCQVVSNQLGYKEEFGRIPAYDPTKVIEI